MVVAQAEPYINRSGGDSKNHKEVFMQTKLTHILGAIALLLVTSSPVWALAVGGNWDIHMDVGGPGGPIATDFHIEGRI